MPINPAIALGVEQSKPVDYLGAYGNALSLKNLVNQGRAQELQLQQGEREQQKQMRLSDLARASGGDMDKFAAGYGEIDPLGAMDFGIKTKQLDMQRRKAALEQADGFNKLFLGSANAVKAAGYSQDVYNAELQRLRAMGVPDDMLANVPAQVSPQYIDANIQAGMTNADRLAREREDFDRRYPGELGKMIAAADLYRQDTADMEKESQPSGPGSVDPVTGALVAPPVRVAPTPTPFDPAIARLRFGNENQPFSRDSSGRVVPNQAVQDFERGKAKAGAPSVNVYPPGAIEPSKTTRADLEKETMSASSAIQRFNQIQQGFKPEYLQFAPRLSAEWAALKEKGGANLSPGDQRFLQDYSAWSRGAIEEVNTYIQQKTGAAMGVQEAQRLIKGVPNPGQGMLDGDSPTQFKAKLDDTMRQLKMVEARSIYALRNGLSLMGPNGEPLVPLSAMPKIMDERGLQIEQQVRKQFPNLNAKELKQMVVKQLGVEFGIGSD
jgi:hypothetical protein